MMRAILLLVSLLASSNPIRANLISWLDPAAQMDPLPPEYPVRGADTPLGSRIDASTYLSARPAWPMDLARWHALQYRMQQPGMTGNITLVFLGGSFSAGKMYGLEDFDKEAFPSYHPQGYSNANLSLPCRSACEHVAAYKHPSLYNSTTTGEMGTSIQCRPCAYPRRFLHYLEAAYPHLRGRIHVHNLAEPGSNSQSILATLEESLASLGQPVDAFFIAYGDNDRNFDERDEGIVGASFELLVRFLLHLRHRPAVIDLELYTDHIERNDGISEGHRKVLRHYQLPTLNYDASAKVNFSELPEQARHDNTSLVSAEGRKRIELYGFRIMWRHPAWPYHQMLSDLIAFAWADQAESLEARLGGAGLNATGTHSTALHHGPIQEYHDARNILLRCVHPVSLVRGTALVRPSSLPPLEASEAIESRGGKQNVAADFGWRYGEDVPGNAKPGWFIDSTRGGERIVFSLAAYTDASWPLTVGIGYLSSYGDMGRVAVRVFAAQPMLGLVGSADGIAYRPARQAQASAAMRDGQNASGGTSGGDVGGASSFAGVVIDGREGAGGGAKNVSMAAFHVLCDGPSSSSASSASSSSASSSSTDASIAPAAASNPSNRTERTDSDGAFLLPSCRSLELAPRRRHKVSANLNIFVSLTLLPALDPAARRNRFKILYVLAC